MPRVTYILPDGTERSIDAPRGSNLMQVAVDAHLPGILGECGGSAMCATCHVYVEDDPQGTLWDPDPVEDSMLDSAAAARCPNSRLSCQLVVNDEFDGLKVRIPERQV
jgi:2Fe-2S ferredoxin